MQGGDFLGKVRAGQKLEISASAWNEIMDAVAWVRQQRGGGRTPPQIQAGMLSVRNETGADLTDRFNIVRIMQPVVFPSEEDTAEQQALALLTFQNNLCLVAASPAENQPFAIVGPLAEGRIGAAVADGLTQCRIRVTEDTDGMNTADAVTGVTDYLGLSASGSALVVWREVPESLPATVWGVVLLNAGGIVDVTFEDCGIVTTKRG